MLQVLLTAFDRLTDCVYERGVGALTTITDSASGQAAGASYSLKPFLNPIVSGEAIGSFHFLYPL